MISIRFAQTIEFKVRTIEKLDIGGVVESNFDHVTFLQAKVFM